MPKYKYDPIEALVRAGISFDDAQALRRISMTLDRWHALECGDSNDYGSWAIVRGYNRMPTHWHRFNPWRESVVYVPLRDLAEAIHGGTVRVGDTIKPYDVDYILAQWAQYGEKLDAYILPQPSGQHSVGVRYGKKGEQYLSPSPIDQPQIGNVKRLLERFQMPDFVHDDDGAPFIEYHSHREAYAFTVWCRDDQKPDGSKGDMVRATRRKFSTKQAALDYLQGIAPSREPELRQIWTRYTSIADREKGARKRLAAIMARYPGFASYVQGDPRGCALYVLSPEMLQRYPVGQPVDSIYSRGIAVCK